MAWLRAAWRLAAFAVFTSIMFVIVLITRLLLAFAPASRRRVRNALFKAWARVIAVILGMRVEVNGPAPSTPFLLISNHLSYMDIVLLATRLDAVFVAKMEVASWPLLGPIVRSVNTIFINRGNRRDLLRVSDEIGTALAAGEGIVVFAEGTSSNGAEVLPLKPSLLEAALEAELPVHYARVTYTTPEGTPDAGEVVCWWDDTPLVTHLLRLFRLPRFGALVHFGPEAVVGRDRKELAQVLRDRISALPTTTTEQPLHAH